MTAQVGEDGPRGPRDARGTYREQQKQEEVQRHSETSHRARLSSKNKVGAMRYKADYVEGAGSNRYRAGSVRSGNRRSGDMNKNRPPTKHASLSRRPCASSQISMYVGIFDCTPFFTRLNCDRKVQQFRSHPADFDVQVGLGK